MSAAATAPPSPRVADAPRARGSLALPVVLWLAGAVISGFTLRRNIGPLDEGILMQAATRMGDGQWPWRDFSWAYGPGEPLVVMAALKAFGPSLLWWRLLRVAADATVAVLIWALVRQARPAARGWALAAWAAAAVTAAQPTSANPTAAALAFALASVLLAARGRPAWAGLLAAVAAFWRPDLGVRAALAAAAALALAARGEGEAATGGDGARGGDARVVPGSDRRRRDAARCLAAALVAGLVLYAPFAVVAGPGRVWAALVVQSSHDGAWWRLPFPPGFHAQPGATAAASAKDFAAWLAPFAAML